MSVTGDINISPTVPPQLLVEPRRKSAKTEKQPSNSKKEAVEEVSCVFYCFPDDINLASTILTLSISPEIISLPLITMMDSGMVFLAHAVSGFIKKRSFIQKKVVL